MKGCIYSSQSAGLTGSTDDAEHYGTSCSDDFKFTKWHIKYCCNTGVPSIIRMLRGKWLHKRKTPYIEAGSIDILLA